MSRRKLQKNKKFLKLSFLVPPENLFGKTNDVDPKLQTLCLTSLEKIRSLVRQLVVLRKTVVKLCTKYLDRPVLRKKVHISQRIKLK